MRGERDGTRYSLGWLLVSGQELGRVWEGVAWS